MIFIFTFQDHAKGFARERGAEIQDLQDHSSGAVIQTGNNAVPA